eukprot:762927-Hanusia_phi.AAC.2
MALTRSGKCKSWKEGTSKLWRSRQLYGTRGGLAKSHDTGKYAKRQRQIARYGQVSQELGHRTGTHGLPVPGLNRTRTAHGLEQGYVCVKAGGSETKKQISKTIFCSVIA